MRDGLKRRWYIITTSSGEVKKYSTSPKQAIKDLYKCWYGISGRGAEERVRKIDEGVAVGLPFRCEADSIEEALECYNDTHCEYEYLQATECEYEEEGVTP